MQGWYVITDFGARKDTLCTAAIQQAIDAAGQQGGTVYVPPGTYLTGELTLRSGVTLNIDPAGVILGSPDINDYPSHDQRVVSADQHRHLLFADNAHDITITGGGAIDGNGMAFWLEPLTPGGWYREKPDRVHPMLEFRRCRRLRIENVTVRNSPGWTVHPFCCDDVILRAVRLDNHLHGPNTDGFDINGCRDVQISDCKLSCGDDGIIIKASAYARSTERVTITNCIINTNCIGIGIGQETESDVRHVAVSNCVLFNCHRMFAIGIWNGGTVEHVTVNNLVGDTLNTYPLARPIQLEVKRHIHHDDAPLGVLRHVHITNVVARTAGRILLTAEDGASLDHVLLRDVRLDVVGNEDAAVLSPATGKQGSNQYANRNLEARRQNAAIVAENMRDLVIDNLAVNWPEDAAIPRMGLWARHIHGGRLDLARLNASLGAPVSQLADVHDILGV